MAKVETEEEYQWRAIEERDEACVVDAIEYEKEKARGGGFWNDHSHGFDRGWDKCQAWTRANPPPSWQKQKAAMPARVAVRRYEEEYSKIVEMHSSGMSARKIAIQLECSRTTVRLARAAFDSAVKGPP